MNNYNAMKVSIIGNEKQKTITPSQSTSFRFSLSNGDDNHKTVQQNKLRQGKSSSLINANNNNKAIKSSNSNSSLNGNSNRRVPKDIDFESGLKKVGAERNKFTKHCPYIMNKDINIFIKDDYESEYIPNRIGKVDFSTIKTSKNKDYQRAYPKTTKFLNHNPSLIQKALSANNIHQGTISKTNWNDNNELMQIPNTTQSKYSTTKTFGFPFLNTSKTNQLYLQLDQSQKEMLTDYIDLFNSKTNCSNSKGKNTALNNITSFLDLNYKNSIPLTFPKCVSSITSNLTKGQKNRYDKMIEELLKVKYLISLDKKNEMQIIKEFLFKHGVYNDYVVTDMQLKNCANFIQGKWDGVIDMNKTFKAILIEVSMNKHEKNNGIDQGRSRSRSGSNKKEHEKSIEEHFPPDDTNGLDEGKVIQDYCSCLSEYKNKKHYSNSKSISNRKHRVKVDIYGKLSLSKQKLLYVNESKGIDDIVKDLELELLQLKMGHCNNQGNRVLSSVFPKKDFVSKTNLYLTQSKSLLKNEGGNNTSSSISNSNNYSNSNSYFHKFILSNKPLNTKGIADIQRNQSVKDSSSTDKTDKLSLNHLNERFYYSGLNKRELDIKAIRSNKKITEHIVLKRTKRRLALEKMINHFQNEDDIII